MKKIVTQVKIRIKRGKNKENNKSAKLNKGW